MTNEAIGRKLEETWNTIGDELYGYVLSMVRRAADAEDVLQNAFLRLARTLEKGTDVDNYRAYLYRIARNEALRLIEGRKRTPIPNNEMEEFIVESSSHFIEAEMDVTRILDSLPQEQREVVVLKLFQEFTFEEVAEVMGIGLKTAASRYRYALEKLRRRQPIVREVQEHVVQG